MGWDLQMDTTNSSFIRRAIYGCERTVYDPHFVDMQAVEVAT